MVQLNKFLDNVKTSLHSVLLTSKKAANGFGFFVLKVSSIGAPRLANLSNRTGLDNDF